MKVYEKQTFPVFISYSDINILGNKSYSLLWLEDECFKIMVTKKKKKNNKWN